MHRSAARCRRGSPCARHGGRGRRPAGRLRRLRRRLIADPRATVTVTATPSASPQPRRRTPTATPRRRPRCRCTSCAARSSASPSAACRRPPRRPRRRSRPCSPAPRRPRRAAGLTSAVPRGTRLLGLSIDGTTARVDLSAQFAAGGGSLSMQARVAQVVYTLTRFPTINAVDFMLDGALVETLGGEGLILDAGQTPRRLARLRARHLRREPGRRRRADAARSSSAARPASSRARSGALSSTPAAASIVRAPRCRPHAARPGAGASARRIAFSTTAATSGTLIVYSQSMEDGSRQDEVRIPGHVRSAVEAQRRAGRRGSRPRAPRERQMAGSAGVTPACVGLEPTLILPIDPPRTAIVLRACQGAATFAPKAAPAMGRPSDERPRHHDRDADGQRLVDVARARAQPAQPAVNADGRPGTAAMVSGDTSPASMKPAAGVASKMRSQRASPSASVTGRTPEPDVERRLQARRIGLDDLDRGAAAHEAARGGATHRAEPEEQYVPADEAPGRRLERGHVAVGGGRVVVDAAPVAGVQGDEAEVVGEEHHLRRRRRTPPGCRARRAAPSPRPRSPGAARMATTQSLKPPMTPSPLVTGTAATRAP